VLKRHSNYVQTGDNHIILLQGLRFTQLLKQTILLEYYTMLTSQSSWTAWLWRWRHFLRWHYLLQNTS